MRVNLIFTPYVSPSCVPIGMASLKSYVEEKTKRVSVKTIDLNLIWIDKIVKGEIMDVCKACRLKGSNKCWAHLQGFKNPYKKIPRELVEIFRLATNLIRDNELVYNKDLFVQYIFPLPLFVWLN